jgi:hypothetical protein
MGGGSNGLVSQRLSLSVPRMRPDLTRSVFSTKLRIYRIGKLRRVTICRELMHSDQINKSEDFKTDQHLSFARDQPPG